MRTSELMRRLQFELAYTSETFLLSSSSSSSSTIQVSYISESVSTSRFRICKSGVDRRSNTVKHRENSKILWTLSVFRILPFLTTFQQKMLRRKKNQNTFLKKKTKQENDKIPCDPKNVTHAEHRTTF